MAGRGACAGVRDAQACNRGMEREGHVLCVQYTSEPRPLTPDSPVDTLPAPMRASSGASARACMTAPGWPLMERRKGAKAPSSFSIAMDVESSVAAACSAYCVPPAPPFSSLVRGYGVRTSVARVRRRGQQKPPQSLCSDTPTRANALRPHDGAHGAPRLDTEHRQHAHGVPACKGTAAVVHRALRDVPRVAVAANDDVLVGQFAAGQVDEHVHGRRVGLEMRLHVHADADCECIGSAAWWGVSWAHA